MPDPTPTPPPLPRLKPPPLWRETLDEHDELEEGDQVGNQRIGGWLIFFAIGRVLAPLFLAAALVQNLAVVTKPRVWALLTTPGSKFYHPLWSVGLFYEIGGHAVLLLFSIALVCIFFTRWKGFPPLMGVYMGLLPLFVWGDYLICAQIPNFSAEVSSQLLGKAIFSTLTALIWIPYFLTSVRVRHTFVK